MSDPDFKKSFAGLPEKNSGIVYLNPRLGETITSIQADVMATPGDPDRGERAPARLGEVNQAPGGQPGRAILRNGHSELEERHCHQAQVNSCINNLRTIDAAKEQTALAGGVPAGATVQAAEISVYMRGGMPKCPQGGECTINVIGDQ